MIALLLAACHQTDPELDAISRSLTAWDEGKAALDRGDAAAARAAFHRAGEIRGSPLLTAWEAKAAADAGDLEGAVALLDQAITAIPSFSEARYDKAAYLARLKRGPEAAQELAKALESGEIRPLTVLEDPDFAPYLGDPAFAFLPQQPLSVAVEPPAPTAFWGAEVSLRLRVLGLVKPPVRFAPEKATGPAQLVSVVQDSVATGEGRALDVRWTWKIVGAGTIELGPITVTAGDHSAKVDPIVVAASAPPDKVVPKLEPLTLPTYDELAAQVGEGTVARVGQSVLARAGPGDRVETTPAVAPATKYEERELGETKEVLYRWAPDAGITAARLTDPTGAVRSELR